MIDLNIINALKVFAPATLAFFLGLLVASPLNLLFFRHQLWKKKARNEALGGGETPIFYSLHKEKEVGTPRLGGMLVWLTVFLSTFFLWLVSQMFPSELSRKLSFLSRNQSWLPLFTLVVGSLVGLADDILQIYGKGNYF